MGAGEKGWFQRESVQRGSVPARLRGTLGGGSFETKQMRLRT